MYIQTSQPMDRNLNREVSLLITINKLRNSLLMSKTEHGPGRKERRNSLWWNLWILLSWNKVFCFSEPARDKMINPFPGHDIPIWANVNHLTYNWPQNSPKMFSSIVARFWTFFVRLTNSFWMAHPLCNVLQDKVSWLFSSI